MANEDPAIESRFVDEEFQKFYIKNLTDMITRLAPEENNSQLFFFANSLDVHENGQTIFAGRGANIGNMELLNVELTREDFFRFVELSHTLHQLESQELLAILGRKIGHDLANPMTAIMMNQEFVLTEVEDLISTSSSAPKDIEQLNTIKQILQNQSKSVTKITDVIDHSRKFLVESHDHKKLEMLEFVKLLYLLNLIIIPPQAIVFITVKPSTLALDFDSLRIVSYLLKNALEAKTEYFHSVTVEILRHDKDLKITLTDNGMGISKEKEFQLTKPLFTTKSGHLGVGLTLVEQIVQAKGGTMKINHKAQRFEINISS